MDRIVTFRVQMENYGTQVLKVLDFNYWKLLYLVLFTGFGCSFISKPNKVCQEFEYRKEDLEIFNRLKNNILKDSVFIRLRAKRLASNLMNDELVIVSSFGFSQVDSAAYSPILSDLKTREHILYSALLSKNGDCFFQIQECFRKEGDTEIMEGHYLSKDADFGQYKFFQQFEVLKDTNILGNWNYSILEGEVGH